MQSPPSLNTSTARKTKTTSINNSVAVVEESQPALKAQESSFDKLLKLTKPVHVKSSTTVSSKKKVVGDDVEKENVCTYKSTSIDHNMSLKKLLQPVEDGKDLCGDLKHTKEGGRRKTLQKDTISAKMPMVETVAKTRHDNKMDDKEDKGNGKGSLPSLKHKSDVGGIAEDVDEMKEEKIESVQSLHDDDSSDSTWRPSMTQSRCPNPKSKLTTSLNKHKEPQSKNNAASSFSSLHVNKPPIEAKTSLFLNSMKPGVGTKVTNQLKNAIDKVRPPKCSSLQEPLHDSPLTPPALEDIYQPLSDNDDDDGDGDETLKNDNVLKSDNEEEASLGSAGMLPGFERLSQDSLPCKSNTCTTVIVSYM